MKKIAISEAQKKAIESQQATTWVVAALSVFTLVGAQVMNAITEAKEATAESKE